MQFEQPQEEGQVEGETLESSPMEKALLEITNKLNEQTILLASMQLQLQSTKDNGQRDGHENDTLNVNRNSKKDVTARGGHENDTRNVNRNRNKNVVTRSVGHATDNRNVKSIRSRT